MSGTVQSSSFSKLQPQLLNLYRTFNNDKRSVRTSNRFKIVQRSFHFAGHKFLPYDVDMNIVKSWFIHRTVAITVHNYDEQNDVTTLNDAASEFLQ